ncbi:MAG: flavodoxin family protein [Dehalococcoidales bacterium]|nr:flavodoxin family protein [Dehalococcoidales bacterium]
MNVLGISGTPRKNGNSELLLNEALRPFTEKGWQVTMLKLSELKVNPCCGCDACLPSGKCIQDDDMGIFYSAFSACDAVIVSTPVYYRNVTSRLMAVFERYYAVKSNSPLRGKPGGAISVGRSTGGGGQSIVISVIHNWFLSCGAVCVPGELNGVTASADKPGDILKQENRLRQANILGQNVLNLAERLNTGQPS